MPFLGVLPQSALRYFLTGMMPITLPARSQEVKNFIPPLRKLKVPDGGAPRGEGDLVGSRNATHLTSALISAWSPH